MGEIGYFSGINEHPSYYDKNKDFTTLQAWKDCRELKLFFYKEVVPALPNDEKFDLSRQIKRAAISTTANIAEGYGRYHFREGIQYYRISRGSIYELKDHLISCFDLGYIKSEKYEKGTDLLETSKISLNGFIKYVKNQIQQ